MSAQRRLSITACTATSADNSVRKIADLLHSRGVVLKGPFLEPNEIVLKGFENTRQRRFVRAVTFANEEFYKLEEVMLELIEMSPSDVEFRFELI